MSALSISQASERTGLPVSTLRFYEKSGLLRTPRTPGGYRAYDDRSLQQLDFINLLRGLGLPLKAIRPLSGLWERRPCRSVRAELAPALEDLLERTAGQRAELERREKALREARAALQALPGRDERCAPECSFLTGPPPEPEPVACSLDADAHAARLGQWHALLAVASLTEVGDGVEALLPANRASELAELIVAEQGCCPFLGFELRFAGPDLRLLMTAPTAARALLDDLVGAVSA